MMIPRQRADLTFKDNFKRARHGWVRLTPAHSLKIVEQILSKNPSIRNILDPFAGTGTTGLVAGHYGLRCDLYDINPFLLWLARVKCTNYDPHRIKNTKEIAYKIVSFVRRIRDDHDLWFPSISNIERWWSPSRLVVLAKVFQGINKFLPESCQEKDLLLVAFCRLIIQWSNVAFNHQSMSFKENSAQRRMFNEDEEMCQVFLNDLDKILLEASDNITGVINTHLIDSRYVAVNDTPHRYDAVITSPPYVNRMSYIRELRPYMYWLGYLKNAGEAGELDWKAIGGTWGVATSRLNNWSPDGVSEIVTRLNPLIQEIAQSSKVLSRYVHKYFEDISRHLSGLYHVVVPGGQLYYIVGNSKFYDTLVPVEELYADLMKKHGFENTHIEIIRKRNSKKELFEFLVSATKPF